MLSVAIMSEGTNKSPGAKPGWGKARLGQSALLVELIGRVQTARNAETSATVRIFAPFVTHVAKFQVF
jgi:hypothetical protein